MERGKKKRKVRGEDLMKIEGSSVEEVDQGMGGEVPGMIPAQSHRCIMCTYKYVAAHPIFRYSWSTPIKMWKEKGFLKINTSIAFTYSFLRKQGLLVLGEGATSSQDRWI